MARYLALVVLLVLGYIALAHRGGPVADTLSNPTPGPATPLEEARADLKAASAAAAQLEAKANATYSHLAEKRKTLDPNNSVAVSAFNWEADEYAKIKAQLADQQKEVARLRKLGDLLEAQTALASGPNIAVYSTSWCPACRSAKQYLSEKNIRFQEFDVEKSPAAAAEFRRLGGSGVPLIVINGEKMTGFNPQWVEQQLRK